MDINREFTFRGKQFGCNAYIDPAADPCFVFVEFNDHELINEFGAELTIKTDFEKLLPFGSYDAGHTELRQVIFQTLLLHPEFEHARLKLEALKIISRFYEADT